MVIYLCRNEKSEPETNSTSDKTKNSTPGMFSLDVESTKSEPETYLLNVEM